jgi:transposase-like protein
MSKRMSGDWLAELRGSRAWTEEEARRVLDACAASSATVNAFARSAGLNARRVYWWRERLRATGEGHTGGGRGVERPTATFLPMVVREAAPLRGSGVAVWTRDGHRVEVGVLDQTSAAWVATLIRSLDGVGS